MNFVDVGTVVLVALAAYWGSKKHVLTQISILLGIVGGLLVVSLTYRQLGFLSQSSGKRGIILVILLVAVGFLSFDVALTIGRAMQRRFGWQREKIGRKEMFASGAVAAITAMFMLWLVVTMFVGVLPSGLRQELKSAAIYARIEHSVPFFDVVRRAAAALQPFKSPEVFVGTEPSFNTDVAVSNSFENLDNAVAGAKDSVLRVNAWGCGTTSAGSGFLVHNRRMVVTNAHVVAGATRLSVQDAKSTYTAQTILFDPARDIAVLSIGNDAAGNPLGLEVEDLANGTVVSALGYPGGGGFNASDAIIAQKLDAEGYDIYNKDKIVRQIYALRATIVPGDSGGPLITAAGKVAGLLIGHSTEQNRTGYALTANQIAGSVSAASKSTEAVSTGSCTTM